MVHRQADELDGRWDLTRHQRKRQRRGLRGVCQWCNRPAGPRSPYCEEHRERVNELARRSYKKKADAHRAAYGFSAYRLAKIRQLSPRAQGRWVI